MAKSKTQPKKKTKAKAKKPAKATATPVVEKAWSDPGSIWTPMGGYGIGSDVWNTQSAPSSWDLAKAFEDVVYSCVTTIATSLGKETGKFKLCVATGNGDPQPKSLTKSFDRGTEQRILDGYRKQSRKALDVREVVDHGLLDLLDCPNSDTSFEKLIEMTAVYLELCGSAFWYVSRVASYPQSIHLLPSTLITIEPDDFGNVRCYVLNKDDDGGTRYSPADIIHFKHVFDPLNPYVGFGVSPAKAVWQRIQLLRKEQTTWESILENMAYPSFVASPPDGESYTPQQAERLAKQMTERFRYGGQGGIFVQQFPMELNPLSKPPKDTTALTMYDSLKASVCGAYRVPVPILDMTATTSENADVALRLFQRNCLAPRIDSILDTISHHLCPPRMWLASDSVVQPDKVFELQRTTALVGGNILTVNEGRIREGYDPKPGLDKLLNQLVDVGTASAQTFQANAAPAARTKGIRYRSTHPDPVPLANALKRVFGKVAEKVMGRVKEVSGVQTKAFLPIDDWTHEIAKELTPVLKIYAEAGSNDVFGVIGGSPQIHRLAVLELGQSVSRAALALAESTLSTTDQSVSDAITSTREAVRAGLDQGEADHQLADRIKEIFTDLSERRAMLIAETESSRAKHQGELIAIQSAGVEAKKVWLCDNMACDVCRDLNGKSVGLEAKFLTKGTGPYSQIEHPPGHPGCRCTLQYELEGVDY